DPPSPAALQTTEPATVAGPTGKEEEGRRKQGTDRGGHSDSSFLLSPSSFPAPGPVPSRQSSKHLPSGLAGQMECRGWRYSRWVETHWYHCLLLPRRAWWLVLGLAFVLTCLSGGIALFLPGVLNDFLAEESHLRWLRLPFALIPLLVLGYGTGFL